MNDDFKSLLSDVFGDFLSTHRFHLDSSIADENGNVIDCVFESPDCKLRFYDSKRGGETNCLMGNHGARNDADWRVKEHRSWFYLRELLEVGKGLSLEELQKLNGPIVWGRREQLEKIREQLVPGYTKALMKLAEKTK